MGEMEEVEVAEDVGQEQAPDELLSGTRRRVPTACFQFTGDTSTYQAGQHVFV